MVGFSWWVPRWNLQLELANTVRKLLKIRKIFFTMDRRPQRLLHRLPGNCVEEGLMGQVRTSSCTSGQPPAAPTPFMDVQDGESPRILELVRCPIAATSGTASRRVRSSEARPFRAHPRLGMGVQRGHMEQLQPGCRRARPQCLNPHGRGAGPTGVILHVPMASRPRCPTTPHRCFPWGLIHLGEVRVIWSVSPSWYYPKT
jgi:hypothetical protein